MPTIKKLTGRDAIDMGLRSPSLQPNASKDAAQPGAMQNAAQQTAARGGPARRIHKIDAVSAVQVRPKLHVAFYCRTSTLLEAQQSSIEGQRQHFEKVIASHDDWRLVGGYIEEGVTGTKAEVRPELQRLLRDCREGKIDKILTKSISRFARNTTDCLEMVRELTGLGVSILFEKENLDTGTMGSDLILTLLSAFAAQESQSISQNIRWGIQRQFQNGTYEQPTVPFGYKRTPDGLSIIEEQAAVVREIFTLALSGHGAASISKALNERGIPTYAGKRWEPAQVLLILHNPFYAGDILYQKSYNDDAYKTHKNKGERDQYYLPDHHAPIITHEVFKGVEALIAQRGKECKNTQRTEAALYPFRSRLICAECGMPLHRLKSKTSIIYGCDGFKRKVGGCEKGTRIFEDTVKNAFTTVLNKLAFSQKLPPGNRILDVYINSIRQREREKNRSRLEEIDSAVEMLRVEIDRLAPTIRFKLENRAKLNELRTRVENLRREKQMIETQNDDILKAEQLRTYIYELSTEVDAVSTETDVASTETKVESTETDAAFTEFVERATVKKGDYIEFEFTCGLILRQSIALAPFTIDKDAVKKTSAA